MLIYQGSFTVFSTYVEVILNDEMEKANDKGVLHVCGGDPISEKQLKALEECSPRMWR